MNIFLISNTFGLVCLFIALAGFVVLNVYNEYKINKLKEKIKFLEGKLSEEKK